MLEFIQSMDPASLTISRDGENIGFLQWHSNRSPRIILHNKGEHLSLNNLRRCLSVLETKIKGET